MSGAIAKEEFIQLVKQNDLFKYHIIPSDNLKRWIEEEFSDIYDKNKRYSLKKNPKFDLDKLNSYINEFANKYEIKPIDKILAERIKRENLINITENYEKEGIGYCCINQNKIIGICSSNIIYEDGIEVNIKVDDNYRQLGIATALSSKLILACLEKNKTISWDAANLTSLKLAKKLGFEFDSEYDIYKTKK